MRPLTQIRESFAFFILIWILSTITDIIPSFVGKDYMHCLYVASDTYLFSFIVTIFTNFFKKKMVKYTLQHTILICFLLYDLINLYGLYILKNPSIVNIASIIANSNIDEVKEFFSHSLKPIYLLGLIPFCFLLYLISHFIKTRIQIPYLALFFPLISICTIIHKPYILAEISYGKIILSYKTIIDSPPQLTNYLTNPVIKETRKHHPQNIVVIIGESFNKNYSSLYRYHKRTSPLLEQEKLLYVYENITSPATHTIDAFKAIMSTYSPVRHSNDMWYKMPTIPEVFNIAGYHSIWISNQNRKGFYDNIPSKYSELCHDSEFINENINSQSYDIEVLKKIKEYNINQTKKIYFIHLMGQHVSFNNRYPRSFDHFQPKEYDNYPEHQRINRASYDNATLYNDYVIHSIIQEFSDKETILFYFSDHGLDIYNTNETYCGHSNSSSESQEIGKQIPFMIYVSPSFIVANESDLIENLKMKTKQKYSIDDIIYTIMDIAGYKFEGNNDVEKYSLLAR